MGLPEFLENTVPQYTDNQFFEHFRLSRQIANNIGEIYSRSPHFKNQLGQYGIIAASDQVRTIKYA